MQEWHARGKIWLYEKGFIKKKKETEPHLEDDRLKKGINLFIAAILWLAVLVKLSVVTNPSVVQAYEQQLFPVGAVAYLKSNPIQGNMFNSYTWGGYLQWSLPEVKVFVDGRTDLFGDEIIKQWISMTNAEENWREVVTEWNIQYAILDPNRPIVSVLLESGWKKLYQDETSVILVRHKAR